MEERKEKEMLYNYHTHTKRCNHAKGEDKEYVEAAIKAGFKTLGFSDHAPYLFPEGAKHSTHRMTTAEISDYVGSVRALAKEYEKDIRILCGFELEYYPDFHKEEVAFLREHNPDYLILGQHFLGNELALQVARGKEDNILSWYVTQVLAGLATGDFLYLAHPDVCGYTYSAERIDFEYRRLCEGAKRMGIPLEVNLLGSRESRWYPKRKFFEIAAEVGNEIVFGTDSHSPQTLLDTGMDEALKELAGLDLKIIKAPLL